MEKCKGMWHFDGPFYVSVRNKSESGNETNLVWAFIIQTIEIEGNNKKMGESGCISHINRK